MARTFKPDTFDRINIPAWTNLARRLYSSAAGRESFRWVLIIMGNMIERLKELRQLVDHPAFSEHLQQWDRELAELDIRMGIYTGQATVDMAQIAEDEHEIYEKAFLDMAVGPVLFAKWPHIWVEEAGTVPWADVQTPARLYNQLVAVVENLPTEPELPEGILGTIVNGLAGAPILSSTLDATAQAWGTFATSPVGQALGETAVAIGEVIESAAKAAPELIRKAANIVPWLLVGAGVLLGVVFLAKVSK